MIGGVEGSSFSSAHGATENGMILRPRRSNVTGAICPPIWVTYASIRSLTTRQEGCASTRFNVFAFMG